MLGLTRAIVAATQVNMSGWRNAMTESGIPLSKPSIDRAFASCGETWVKCVLVAIADKCASWRTSSGSSTKQPR